MNDETVEPNAEQPMGTDDGSAAPEPADSINDQATSEATGSDDTNSAATAGDSRRGFMVRFAAAAIGTVVGLVPFLTGLLFFLDPLIRKRSASPTPVGNGTDVIKDEDGFIRLTITVDALPVDEPQAITVRDDKVDAWNKFLNVPIGAIWLRKKESGKIIAFNTICPHLGCSVEFRQGQNEFYCPCHLSAFNLDGKKKNPVPPRGMDELKIKTKSGNDLWLKYQEFRGATHDKIPV